MYLHLGAADRLAEASRFVQVGDPENHAGLPGGIHGRCVARANVDVLGGELPSKFTRSPRLIWDLLVLAVLQFSARHPSKPRSVPCLGGFLPSCR
jgi:hypothetical protein